MLARKSHQNQVQFTQIQVRFFGSCPQECSYILLKLLWKRLQNKQLRQYTRLQPRYWYTHCHALIAIPSRKGTKSPPQNQMQLSPNQMPFFSTFITMASANMRNWFTRPNQSVLFVGIFISLLLMAYGNSTKTGTFGQWTDGGWWCGETRTWMKMVGESASVSFLVFFFFFGSFCCQWSQKK